jgi:hypothetical protein
VSDAISGNLGLSRKFYVAIHYCPVRSNFLASNPLYDSGFWRFWGVHDLNCMTLICDAFGLIAPEARMNAGKTLFAQVMEFVPWKTFGRIIERRNGDAGARTLNCAELFRIMAFSRLTWRESLRDIEACLDANQNKLFHMGLGSSPARSTLSDALNQRDWRIHHSLALRLIARARALYADEPALLNLDAAVYALGSTTIDPGVHPHQRRQAARRQRAG